MALRITLFMPPRSSYGVLHHFTEKFAEALSEEGAVCEILEAEYYNPKPFLEKLLSDKPDCTLSFNGLLPDEEGRFFCDLINIPHVGFVVDTPTYFLPLAHSPHTIIANVDFFGCEFFRNIGNKKALFIPHGIERNIAPIQDNIRDRNVAMFTSLIDYNTLQRLWKEKYSPALIAVMEATIEKVLFDDQISLVQAFVNTINQQGNGAIDVNKINFIAVLDDLEMYIKGRSRIDLLRSVTDSAIDLYGAEAATAHWMDYLQGCDHITIHEPVPFEQALDLMQQYKIVLNASPWIKGGGHERIFAAQASGALVVTSANDFLKQYFHHGRDILYYENGDLSEVNSLVNEYLSDDDKRQTLTKKAREQTMNHHTWNHRARALLEELPPLLEAMKTNAPGN